MPQVIRIKRSDVAGNTPSTLETGELAINTTDGLLFGRVNHSIVELNPLEMGGKLWDTDTDYIIGDVVSYDNGLYIALTDNDSEQPDVSPLMWYSFKTVFTDVGDFDPTSGIFEYPDTNVVEPNAIWNIVGLGVNGYYMTASGPFKGETVKTEDKFIWQGYSADGVSLWLLDKAPRLNLERGGIAYNLDIDYIVGDVVTENDVSYRCTAATTGAFVAADWQSLEVDEVGGKLWDPAINYDVGDVVGYVVGFVGSSYVCIQPNINNDPTTSLSHWSDISEVEVGGRIYDIGNDYLEGDIVTHMNIVYHCTTDAPAGGFDPNKWEAVNTGSETFIGLSDVVNTYTGTKNIAVVNDFNDGIALVAPAAVGATINLKDLRDTPAPAGVTDDGKRLTFLDDGLGNSGYVLQTPVTTLDGLSDVSVPGPSNDDVLTHDGTQWIPKAGTAPEVGGIAWVSGTNYVIGDVTTEVGNIYICNTDDSTSSVAPSGNGSWSALSLLEKGGLLYNNTLAYDIGDIVSYSNGIYAAKVVVPAGVAQTPPNATYWATVAAASIEIGGRKWVSSTVYAIGDIVTEAGVVYHCTIPNSDAVFTPGNWQAVGGASAEVGGKVYNTTTTYAVGDIVSYDNGVYIGAYVCTAPTSGLWAPGKWDSTDLNTFIDLTDTVNAYTAAGDIAVVNSNVPPDGIELVSPATVGTTINLGDLKDITAPTVTENGKMLVWNEGGSSWIYGAMSASTFLGLTDTVDTDYLTKANYVARVNVTTDPDGDAIELVSPATIGETINLGDLQDTPSVAAATGQMTIWDDVTDPLLPVWVYSTPVTDIDSLSDVDTTTGPPSDGDVLKWNATAPGYWEPSAEAPEVGGIFYRAATNYVVGDIITADDGTGTELYRCIAGYTSAAGGLPADFLLEVLNWTLLDTDPEKGGIAWEATVDYLKGDIVSDGGVIYLATVDILATPTVPGANSDWFFAQITEKGGVVWATGIAYAAGDIVTDSNGLLYSCNFGHISIVGDPVDGEPGVGTHWVSIGSERGGINWETDMEYYEGDVVTYIYPGDPPPASPPMVPVYEGVFVCNAWHISIVGDGTDGEPTVGGHWTPFVVNNLSSTSVTEALSANQGNMLNTNIGDPTALTTVDKTSAVAAINEVNRVGAAVVDAAAGTEVATINALLASLRTAGLLLP